jgi:hypothetical protein
VSWSHAILPPLKDLGSSSAEQVPADLPGADLVASGIADLFAGRDSVPALLVASFATRLRRLGIEIPPHAIEEPETKLYRLIERDLGDGAHARYNALIQRVDSFASSYACAKR